MSRDFVARKYIAKQCDNYNDIRLKDAVLNAFELMYQNQEPDGCLSTSIALYVILRSYGYSPQLCYGLCSTPEGNEMYHAWLEVDCKILDLAIYGNSHFSHYWLDGEPVGPFVFEEYADVPMQYGNRVFDDDWENSLIFQAFKMGSMEDYIDGCPGNGMWNLIFRIMGEVPSADRIEELRAYVNKGGY